MAAGERQRILSVFGVLVCLLACFSYYWFFFQRAHVELDLVVEQKSRFKLYWAAAGEPFSEKKRASITVAPNHHSYRFFLTDLGRVDRLRLDPIEYAGAATIRSITISQSGFAPVSVDLSSAQPLHDVESMGVEGGQLRLQSKGIDPHFLIEKTFVAAPVAWTTEGFRYLLIVLTVVVVLKTLAPLRERFSFVPVLLAMVFVLVVVMAGISKQNAHPDEYVHLQAADYYREHWLPPAIDDPAIASTYSVYGISRLNNGEIYYLFAGKLAQLASAFQLPDLLSLRLFNLVLFGIVVAYAVHSLTARLIALPFLLSPGIWYLFSYCVSDAFGLVVCFIAGCEVVRRNSVFNRFVFGGNGEELPRLAVLVPFLLAVLLLLKINYYPFIGFLGLIVLWRMVKAEPDQRRRSFARVALIVCLGVIGAGLRIGADYYVNGFDRQQKLTAMQEKRAHPWYKPSTELHRKHVGLYLQERGTSLKEMVVHHRWFEHTLQTGTGMYGYFTISAPQEYYRLFQWCLAAFFACFVGLLLVRGSGEIKVFTVVAVLLAAGLLGVSLYRSWTIDFQAQGRYLFPILPIIGILLGCARNLFDNRLFYLLFALLFLLSLYSFIFVGLAAIPRLAG